MLEVGIYLAVKNKDSLKVGLLDFKIVGNIIKCKCINYLKIYENLVERFII